MSKERSHDGAAYDIAAATSAPARTAPPKRGKRKAAADDDEPKKSVTTQLVDLAEEYYRVLLAEDGAPYAVELNGPNLAIPLRGRDSLRQRLARLFFEATSIAPAGAALADALAVLEGAATRYRREPVALRLARDFTGAIVLDLGRPDGQCVIVEPGSWRVVTRSPVLFRRTALTGEMPLPVGGGDIETLLGGLVNAGTKTVRLLTAWAVVALIPELPHPILAIFGEQGSAKTSLMRMLAMLLDPSPAPTRTAPRDIGQWAVTASASWLVAIDNVSVIPEWLSDAMCRAVTGDGLTSRALYSDADVSVLTFRRVLALTSIDAGALRGDLGERLLPAELDVIAPDKRETDAEVTAAFEEAAPALLGALLDLLADVLLELPWVKTTQLPRLADFAKVLHALDAVKKPEGWSTVADYAGTAADIAETVIESDPFAVAIRTLVPSPATAADRANEWTGTATELLSKITPDRAPKGWPGSPRAVAGAVKRITPALRAVGITVDHGRTSDRTRTRTLTFTGPPYTSPVRPSEPSEPSERRPEQQERSDGSSDGCVRTLDERRTVRTVDAHGAAQPSDDDTPDDLAEYLTSDGSDGSVGSSQPDYGLDGEDES